MQCRDIGTTPYAPAGSAESWMRGRKGKGREEGGSGPRRRDERIADVYIIVVYRDSALSFSSPSLHPSFTSSLLLLSAASPIYNDSYASPMSPTTGKIKRADTRGASPSFFGARSPLAQHLFPHSNWDQLIPTQTTRQTTQARGFAPGFSSLSDSSSCSYGRPRPPFAPIHHLFFLLLYSHSIFVPFLSLILLSYLFFFFNFSKNSFTGVEKSIEGMLGFGDREY